MKNILFLFKRLLFLSCLCFTFNGCSSNSEISDSKVDIPSWKEPSGMMVRELKLGFGEKDESASWSAYSSNERAYIHEVLPAIFKRTLVIDSIDGDRGIKWIFTCPQQGIYMELNQNKFRFSCKYYDSFGYNNNLEKLPRFPQFEHSVHEITADKPVKAITIEMNYKLGLLISLNGQTVIEQTFMDDIVRNQIHLTGKVGTLAARLLEPEIKHEKIIVNPEIKYQQMLGWGGIGTPTANNELNEDGKSKWWEYIAEYNLLCQREYPVGGQLHKNLDNWDNINYAKAHYYGENFPNWEISDFDYNKKIQEMGGFVMFEFWDFPRWIENNEQEYTRAMVGYCTKAKRKTGKAQRIVGVQNEQEMSEENVKRFVPALRKALNEAGFEEVKIHMANAPYVSHPYIVKGNGIERLNHYTKNPEVWDVIDYSATNMYDYQQFFTNPDGFDSTLIAWHKSAGTRPFLSTELCINDTRYQTDSYRLALTMGQLYEKNLTITNAVLIAYCWTILNTEQPSFATRTLFVSSPEDGFMPMPTRHLRVFGAYSRRIKEGMTRVDVKCANKDIKAVAFMGEEKHATMVIQNRSENPVNLDLDWKNILFNEIETVDPYSNNIVKSFIDNSITVAPGAIITLTNVPLNQISKK